MFEKVPGAPVDKFGFSPPDFEIVRDASRSYTGMFAYRNETVELSGVGESQRVVATRVSPEMFGVLGVAPIIGRALTADDDRAEHESGRDWLRSVDPRLRGATGQPSGARSHSTANRSPSSG